MLILDFKIGKRCVHRTTIQGVWTCDPNDEAHPIEDMEGYMVYIKEDGASQGNRAYTINRFFYAEETALRFLETLKDDCTHLELYTPKRDY